jgi:hypothetical protein
VQAQARNSATKALHCDSPSAPLQSFLEYSRRNSLPPRSLIRCNPACNLLAKVDIFIENGRAPKGAHDR